MDYPVSGRGPNVAEAMVPHTIDAGGNAVPVSAANPLPLATAEDTVTLTKASVTMTGVSAQLVAASASRSMVIVVNSATNSPAAVDPTGGTAALDAGIQLVGGGDMVRITGKAAQSAMTQIGTNGEKLTVYTG
jgi:hypothetical protein